MNHPRRQPPSKAHSGFTIIELLVVIVVVAILATISILAYNGIQKRAGTAAYVAAADTAEKQIRLASVDDKIPQATYIHDGCLGDVSDFPATNELAAGECARYTNESGEVTSYTVDPSASTLLRTAGVEAPARFPTVRIITNGQRIVSRGIIIGYIMSNAAWLVYYPPDSSSCGRGLNFITLIIQMYEEAMRSDPSFESTLVNTYGTDWRQGIRNGTYGGSGVCWLTINLQ